MMLIHPMSCCSEQSKQYVCMCVPVCVLFAQGFEPRGTSIGVRQLSLSKLQENTGPGKTLSSLPPQLSKRSAKRMHVSPYMHSESNLMKVSGRQGHCDR